MARTKNRFSAKRSGGGMALTLLVLVLLGAGGFAAWGALRLGPAPSIELTSEREAIGGEGRVQARFLAPSGGLGNVRLELVQGDRVELIAERSFPRGSSFRLLPAAGTAETTLEATVGRKAQSWLAEGEAVLRARADRMTGPLRAAAEVSAEKRLPVRLRPPRLDLLSQQHYVRQGGSGVVVFRVGDSATRSGVRAGSREVPSYERPGGTPGERFALFPVPWDDAKAEIKVFAEDDAGNRAELSFITLYKSAPPKSDTIDVSDEFLHRVVPAIASQTPGFDATRELLDQYLEINREIRKANLAQVASLAAKSEESFLWSGAFMQMPNTQRRANFAERRTYIYRGQTVDQQTHLGLDLASNAQAPVPAANAGNVVFADWLGIYGNTVVVDHGYGLMSLYGHLSAVAVEAGQRVSKGQTVGSSGTTGLAGGDHLHLEVLVQGYSVDPFEWLDAKWIRDNIGTKMPAPGL